MAAVACTCDNRSGKLQLPQPVEGPEGLQAAAATGSSYSYVEQHRLTLS
jgi:hypothetical protein